MTAERKLTHTVEVVETLVTVYEVETEPTGSAELAKSIALGVHGSPGDTSARRVVERRTAFPSARWVCAK